MMNIRERLKDHKRIVIKVGTSTLTYENGRLNLKTISALAWTIADLRNCGKEVILVTSGAVAVGVDRLGLSERPKDIIGKQAASAVGQGILMQIYENFFMEYNQKVAQILLTSDVLEIPVKKTNARNAFFKLLELGVVPIVNANDTISVEELDRLVSENDTLSAYVACLTESDCLIILSDINGMYTSDPREDETASLMSVVYEINDNIAMLAGSAGSKFGTGGMATKIAAAKITCSNGIDTVIASGADPKVLFGILNGDDIGTLFVKN